MSPRSLKATPDDVVVSAGRVAGADDFADLTDADDDQFRDTGAASIHANSARQALVKLCTLPLLA